MFIKALSAVAALAVSTAAQTYEQHDEYAKWSAAIGIWGWNWEPHTITTDDGYILTLMHITNKTGVANSQPTLDKEPILYISPMGSTPHSWLDFTLTVPDLSEDYSPLIISVLEDGHDTWMVYPRGTFYSLDHVEYSNTSAEFWDFSWYEQGRGDIKAAVDFIIEN